MNRTRRGAGKVPWLSLFKYRQAWSIIVARFMTDPVWWFFLIWLPDYFKKTRNLDISHSWVHLAAIYAIITVLSNIGGWLPGYLMKRGWSVTRARKTAMFIFALCVVPILFATSVGNWSAVFLIALAGFAHHRVHGVTAWSSLIPGWLVLLLCRVHIIHQIRIFSPSSSRGGFCFGFALGCEFCGPALFRGRFFPGLDRILGHALN